MKLQYAYLRKQSRQAEKSLLKLLFAVTCFQVFHMKYLTAFALPHVP